MSFRPIFGLPRLSQDWGTEQAERETHWTSLFYDLMIVAALNAIAEPFEEEEEDELAPIRHLWLDALLQFVSVVNPWNALNEYTSMIEDESFLGHTLFFVHCFGLAATTAGCVGELSENYNVLATGIILAKIGLLVLYLRPIIYLPRTRVHVLVRCAAFLANILLILWGMSFQGADAFERFRNVLIAATFLDWGGLFLLMMVPRQQRVPIHIKSYSDRIKEVTMVIFGEAIFAIILQPYKHATPQTHFYSSLGCTLWLIYSLALQEFHLMPSEDDHALRRSVACGFLWYYTQFFKQIFLLGTSIGIKRAHLLTFQTPDEPVDQDTRRLIVWGLSLTMFTVLLIRSYSFGWGRHPSKHDSFGLYWLKVGWWLVIGSSCVAPQLVDMTVLRANSKPLFVLVTFGVMMSVVILFEMVFSNLVASHLMQMMNENNALRDSDHEGEPGELTYLHHPSSISNYSSRGEGEETEERRTKA